MNRLFAAIALCIAITLPLSAQNNDWPKVRQECDEVVSPTAPEGGAPITPLWKRAMACGTGIFTARPAHPTIKSIVPGGGFGPGLTFQREFNRGKWQKKIGGTGASSFQAFWSVESRFRATHDRFGKNNTARDRFALDVYAAAQGLPYMDYYGIGPETSKSSVVNFRERQVVAGADMYNPFSSWLGAGGSVEGIWPEVSGTTEGKNPSITTAFDETTAPGLVSQPTFVHYDGYVLPRRERGKFQFKYNVSYGMYQDTRTGHYSFRRFKVDGTHTFHPFGGKDDVLTVHDRLTISDTSNGNVVPFYLQETLGGTDITGQPTLRGFADYRFRGPDLTLIQVEYNKRVWGPLGGLAFYDTGQVADRASDLSLAQMRHSFGFGLSFWAGDKTWFKIYVGLGGGEGVHPYFGIPKF